MRGRPAAGWPSFAALAATLVLLQCRREAPPPAPAGPAGAPTAQALDPWSFHFVGGLLVITGEVEDPVVVTLRGTTLNETRSLPFGPVRWELVRPPAGEVAELRTAEGKLLMRFDFSQPPPPRERHLVPLTLPPASPRPGPGMPPARPTRALAEPPVAPAPSHPVPRPVQGTPPRPLPALLPPPRLPASPPPMAPARPAPKASPVPPPRPTPAPAPAPRVWPMPVPAPAPKVAPTPVPRPMPVPAPRPTPVPAAPPRTASALPIRPPSGAQPIPPASQNPVPGGSWPGAGEACNILKGPQGGRRIALTFDGGSSAEVAVDVLDALRARGIRTTLFLTGEFIRKYPDLVRRMAREGHELGNHTLSHPHLAPSMHRDPRWTRERFQRELLEADRILFQLLGRPFDPLWRSPYGEQTQELRQWAEELGYRHVGWSEGADTLDWATTHERRLYRTGNAILDKLWARMEKKDGDGIIVLMHLGSGRPDGDRPGQVLGPFLDRALREGWHFVPVGEFVQGLGKPRWEPVRRTALLR